MVWDEVRIREGATIGDECIIGRGAYIDAGVSVGDRVKIQNDALVYHGVTVDSGVFIGPGAILTNDRYPRAITADGQLALAADWTVDEIHLGYGCSIGAGAVVVAGAPVLTIIDVIDHGVDVACLEGRDMQNRTKDLSLDICDAINLDDCRRYVGAFAGCWQSFHQGTGLLVGRDITHDICLRVSVYHRGDIDVRAPWVTNHQRIQRAGQHMHQLVMHVLLHVENP